MPDQLLLQEDDIKKAEAIASNIGIPSPPQLVLDIQNEAGKENPDFARIADLVAKDVSMSARILKVANSPFFSRGKVDSIMHAINLLGIRAFYAAVLSSALREAFLRDSPALDRFWKHSMVTAIAAGIIARKLRLAPEDQAYTAGLFHDCGVVLMMKKFPDYTRVIDNALYITTLHPVSEKFDLIVGYENDRYNTNHCVMGYVMSKSWRLSDAVNNAIMCHHYPNIDMHKDIHTRRLSAVLHLAEFTSLSFDFEHQEFAYLSSQWINAYNLSIKELGVSADDIDIFVEEVSEIANGYPSVAKNNAKDSK